MADEIECSGGECVAVAAYEEGVMLSSTRRPHDAIAIDADEWAAFLADVHAGRYGGVPAAELVELRADRVTLAAENGALRDEVERLRGELADEIRSGQRLEQDMLRAREDAAAAHYAPGEA